MKYLHSGRKFFHDKKILKQIYLTWIRNNLEYGVAVWNSSLTNENILKLERLQKAAVRVIMGNSYSTYEEGLEKLKLDKLSVRREKLCLRFAKNSLKLEQFSKLFPVNESEHAMKNRNSNMYIVKQHLTERYRKSTIPYLQRLLNQEFHENKKQFRKIMNSIPLSPVDNDNCCTAGKI